MAASPVSKDRKFQSVRGMFLFKNLLIDVFSYNNTRHVDNHCLGHRKPTNLLWLKICNLQS